MTNLQKKKNLSNQGEQIVLPIFHQEMFVDLRQCQIRWQVLPSFDQTRVKCVTCFAAALKNAEGVEREHRPKGIQKPQYAHTHSSFISFVTM